MLKYSKSHLINPLIDEPNYAVAKTFPKHAKLKEKRLPMIFISPFSWHQILISLSRSLQSWQSGNLITLTVSDWLTGELSEVRHRRHL